MTHFISIFCFVVTILAVLVNGSLMLISPKLWFQMPAWIRLSNLPEAKYKDGWGGIQIRFVGAVFLALIVYFAHVIFFNTR
jgi:hypothetical protein